MNKAFEDLAEIIIEIMWELFVWAVKIVAYTVAVILRTLAPILDGILRWVAGKLQVWARPKLGSPVGFMPEPERPKENRNVSEIESLFRQNLVEVGYGSVRGFTGSVGSRIEDWQ